MSVSFPVAFQDSIVSPPRFDISVMAISSLLLSPLYFFTQYAVVPESFRVGFPETAFILAIAKTVVASLAITSIVTTINEIILCLTIFPLSAIDSALLCFYPINAARGAILTYLTEIFLVHSIKAAQIVRIANIIELIDTSQIAQASTFCRNSFLVNSCHK